MFPPPEPGGFLPSSPLPPPSGASTTTPPPTPTLPHPRTNPLPPGSRKESALIAHLDDRLLAISRRYETRFQNLPANQGGAGNGNGNGNGNGTAERSGTGTGGGGGKGYTEFGQLAREVGGVVDLVWVSGTPSIQIPSLLTLALLTTTALPSFPFSPRPTFTLLKKLDHAFASLLKGQDVESGEALPGSSSGRGKVSVTEKVRVKGVVERARVVVVEVAGGGTEGGWTEDEEDEEEEEDYDNDNDDEDEDMRVDGNHGRWEMEIARVYERTVVELGLGLDMGTPGGGGGGFG